MRPIKFKAKHKLTNDWVEGHYVLRHYAVYDDTGIDEFAKVPSIYNDDPETRCGDYAKSIIPETLCQYTGMLDMNQTCIWENDRVVIHPIGDPKTECFFGEVIYMETCFAFEDDLGHKTPLYELRKHYDIETIGNKFD